MNVKDTFSQIQTQTFLSNSARFNHSCQSNAESVEYQGNLQIFAIRDIKKGEEISINYGEHFEMFIKTFAERQKYFKETTAFSCICDFCQDGEEDENDIAIYEAFKVLFYHNYVLRIC